MNPDFFDLLLGISTDALDAFDGMVTENIYAPIADFDVDPAGIKKLYATADASRFERWDGKFSFNRLAHRVHTVRPDLFGSAIEVGRPEHETLQTYLGRNLPRLMNNKMSAAQAAIEEEWTGILKKAVDGDSLPNLYNDSKFIGKDIKLPGAAAVGTKKLTNKGKAVDRTIAGVQDAYYQAQALFSKMPKPNGERYHSGTSMGRGLGMMYPLSVEAIIDKAYTLGNVSADQNVERITRIAPQNAQIMTPWDEAGINGMLFYPVQRIGRLMPLYGIRKSEALKVESDIPELSGLPAGFSTQESWSLQKNFVGVTMDMEVSPGSPYGVVFIPFKTDADGKKTT